MGCDTEVFVGLGGRMDGFGIRGYVADALGGRRTVGHPSALAAVLVGDVCTNSFDDVRTDFPFLASIFAKLSLAPGVGSSLQLSMD